MFYVKKKSDALHKKWVDSKNKKCLVIQGARQTGKTYIVERFAEENYEEIVEINFKQIPSAMDTTNEEHILAGKEMMLCAKTQKP